MLSKLPPERCMTSADDLTLIGKGKTAQEERDSPKTDGLSVCLVTI